MNLQVAYLHGYIFLLFHMLKKAPICTIPVHEMLHPKGASGGSRVHQVDLR